LEQLHYLLLYAKLLGVELALEEGQLLRFQLLLLRDLGVLRFGLHKVVLSLACPLQGVLIRSGSDRSFVQAQLIGAQDKGPLLLDRNELREEFFVLRKLWHLRLLWNNFRRCLLYRLHLVR